MRFPKTLVIIALFALATVGSYYVALSLILSVEQAARAQVEQKLRIARYDWASVKTDGLQVILEGEAPTEAMRFHYHANRWNYCQTNTPDRQHDGASCTRNCAS